MSEEAPSAKPPHKAQPGLLQSHRLLTFAGSDAASFLQGYLTCDTDKLTADTAIAGAFTNLKGRVVASGWLWGSANEVQMLLPVSLTETVSDFLKPYMNFSRTKLKVSTEAPAVVLLEELTHDAVKRYPGSVMIGGYGAVLAEHAEPAADLSDDWLASCIAHNEAVVTPAVSGTYLPQMLGLTDLGAVSFDKGCYLGQEVVARAQHRGEVKRRMRLATYQPSAPSNGAARLNAGDKLKDSNGKPVGAVVCATEYAAQIVTALVPHENNGESETTPLVMNGLSVADAALPTEFDVVFAAL